MSQIGIGRLSRDTRQEDNGVPATKEITEGLKIFNFEEWGRQELRDGFLHFSLYPSVLFAL